MGFCAIIEINTTKGVLMAYDLLLERFLRYVKINTRSDENATRTPTTQSQVDFALKVLKPELEELGLSNWVCPISIIWKVMVT